MRDYVPCLGVSKKYLGIHPTLVAQDILTQIYHKLLPTWLSNNYQVIIFYLWVEHFDFYVFRLNVYRLNVFFEGALILLIITITLILFFNPKV